MSDPDEIPLDLLLRGSIHRGAELLDENARLRARVAELEVERDTLKEMVTAMDEANTQLAHRLWCLENPE